MTYEALLLEAKNPCIFFSGGQDSRELLNWALPIRKTPIVAFSQNFTKEQWAPVERTILENNLEAYTYPPAHSMLIPNGKELARVDVYNLSGALFPVLRDVVHSNRCGLELDAKKLDLIPFDFDTVFIGTREGDYSEATGQPLKTDVLDMGPFKLVAPLFYQAKEVEADGRTDEMNEGNLVCCANCLRSGTTEPVYCPKDKREIDGFAWDQAVALKGFRETFGFEV